MLRLEIIEQDGEQLAEVWRTDGEARELLCRLRFELGHLGHPINLQQLEIEAIDLDEHTTIEFTADRIGQRGV